MNGIEKTTMVSMANTFDNHLPSSLSMNHYELAENLGYAHQKWKQFLKIKEVERLIESEIASIAEIGARKALENLRSGNASSADISAAREVLASSKLLKQKHNQKPLVIISRIPKKEFVEHDNSE